MEKVKINFFGVGCRIIKGCVSEELWEKITECAERMKTSVDYAILDNDFFSQLDLKNFKSFDDMENVLNVSGLLNHSKSAIEIRINKKKRAKISSNEIVNQNSLFPLYDVKASELIHKTEGKKNITIVEEETGRIGTFEFECRKFEIEKLKFIVTRTKVKPERTYSIIIELSYDGKALQSVQSDTMVTANFAYIE